MYYSDKTTTLIVAINRDTIEKKLTWTAIDAPIELTAGSEDRISIVYWTDYKERKVVIYTRKYKNYFDESEWAWAEGVVLAIVTPDFKTLWETDEQTQALRDLFSSVSKQASGFNDLLDDLLNS